VFAELLKTFKNISKTALNELIKELHNVVKYKIPFKVNDKDEFVYSIANMNMFHPINIDVSFKHLTEYLIKNKQIEYLNRIHRPSVEYLIKNKQIEYLNRIHRPSVYYKLIDELNSNSPSIYKDMYEYKKSFDFYITKTNPSFNSHFEPKLTFEELQSFLIKHSDKKLYASKYNRYIESEIFRLIQANYDKNLKSFEEYILINKYEHKYKIKFNEQQMNAITSTISYPITLIQGSAGTGKSTLISAITDILLFRNESIIYLTISTKARDVINAKLNQYYGTLSLDDKKSLPKAYTISKFLCKQQFNKTTYDNIIVDEASMIGNSQLIHFLNSFSKRLILMGDGKQVLPVCQIGTPFISLQSCEYMDAFVNICELKIIKRQSSDNPIVSLVDNLLNKVPSEIPEYNNESYGVFYKTIDSRDYETNFAKTYISYYKNDEFNKSLCCIKPAHYAKTSEKIHEYLFDSEVPIAQNNSSFDKFNSVFVGEYMMRCKTETFEIKDPNNHTKKISVEVPNGSYCKVIEKDSYGCIVVEYLHIKVNDELFRERVISKKIFYEFQLAYCQSTHKYQGSEYNNVFINLNNNPFILADEGKNIFYTSITRAKQLLILCGTKNDKLLINRIIVNDFANPVHNIMDGPKSEFVVNNNHRTINCLEEFIQPYTNQYDECDGDKKVFENVELVEEVKTHIKCECGSKIKNNQRSIEAHKKTKKHVSFLGT
jgi:hypothetical protein